MDESNTTNMTPAENPYEAPQEFIRKALGTENLASRGIITVAVAAVLFGFIGAMVGLAIGALAPGYYFTMFPELKTNLAPWAFGLSLGLTQGLIAGGVVGCVVLISVAFYRSRMQNSMAAMLAQYQAMQSTNPQPDAPESHSSQATARKNGGG